MPPGPVSSATVMITSPLEEPLARRVAAVDPGRVSLLYDPALLPPVRYVADHTGAPFTRDAAAEARWQDFLSRADVLFDLPAAADLPRATRLRWVQTTSTGVGPAVARLGLHRTNVLVTTARGVHAGPLAEWTFMALLAHFRGFEAQRTEQRAHRWVRTCYEGVAGRTLLTLGAGDLARGVARVARALGMRVEALARHPDKARPAGLFDAVRPVADLHAALAGADAVVMTLPDTAETRGMLDAAAFAAVRPGCAFVNIGRGSTVVEPALVEALRAGRVGFAALDVAAVEPLPADSPLWDLPNVLISPHSASTVSTENSRIVDIFCDNLRCWLDGNLDGMRNVLDKELLY